MSVLLPVTLVRNGAVVERVSDTEGKIFEDSDRHNTARTTCNEWASYIHLHVLCTIT